MGLFTKISLLFKANKPATELVGELKQAKTGWKTIGFWASLLGTILTLVAALKALIPATAALIIITVITMIYNVVRALDKAGTDTSKGTFVATEFWIFVLGEVTKAMVALQTGGVNPAWFGMLAKALSLANGIIVAASQNLSMQPKAVVAEEK